MESIAFSDFPDGLHAVYFKIDTLAQTFGFWRCQFDAGRTVGISYSQLSQFSRYWGNRSRCGMDVGMAALSRT